MQVCEDLSKVDFVLKRVFRYISQHPEGLSSSQMQAWASSVRLYDVEWFDVDAALRTMRDSGAIAVANGLWYARDKKAKYL